MARAFVGLGANLGAREETLARAVERLRAHEGVDVVAISELRETDPVGVVDQPRFLNGAVDVETSLSPRALLDVLLEVERELGRVRRRALGAAHGRPRPARLRRRDDRRARPARASSAPARAAFALEPLAELDPDLVIPGRGTVSALLSALD